MASIIYIDIDDTLADMKTALKNAKQSNPKMPFPQAEYGFYANLTPLSGAIEAVRWLLSSPAFKPYILTAPSIMNPLSYTEKRVWVEKYLGMEMVERLIISPDKSLLKGEYLVDDNIQGRGQEAFEGTVFHYGSRAYPDWDSVINTLKQKEALQDKQK